MSRELALVEPSTVSKFRLLQMGPGYYISFDYVHEQPDGHVRRHNLKLRLLSMPPPGSLILPQVKFDDSHWHGDWDVLYDATVGGWELSITFRWSGWAPYQHRFYYNEPEEASDASKRFWHGTKEEAGWYTWKVNGQRVWSTKECMSSPPVIPTHHIWLTNCRYVNDTRNEVF
jgi:hypothetical protein